MGKYRIVKDTKFSKNQKEKFFSKENYYNDIQCLDKFDNCHYYIECLEDLYWVKKRKNNLHYGIFIDLVIGFESLIDAMNHLFYLKSKEKEKEIEIFEILHEEEF